MEGSKKFQEVAKKLKEEVKAVEEEKQMVRAEVKSQLAALAENAELAGMYNSSAQMGADNLSGDLPLLKIHAAGKSTKNILADGSRPNDGWFFYKPTQEQFEAVTCHIMTISKGFRAPGLQEGGKEVFNQILGGVIVVGTEYKPFIMYLTGLKLSYMWEFGKEAKKYTQAKPVAIPMFALSVKLIPERKENSFGESWIMKFEIEKTENNQPKVVLDPGEFQFLRDNVEMVEETIAGLIAKKSAEDENGTAYIPPAEMDSPLGRPDPSGGY